jgi:hypothetical protein
MPGSDKKLLDISTLEFHDLEDRYGHDNARSILRTLEQFEGVNEAEVAKFSWQDRLSNVFDLMKEGMRFHTRH